MLAFINGLQKGSYMRHKLQCDKNAGILTLNDMIHYASNCAAADDAAGGTMLAMLPSHKKNNNNNGNKNNGKRKKPSADQQAGGSDNMVAMTFSMEARAEPEAVVVVPEPAGARSMLKQHKLPEPTLPNP